MQKSKVNFKAAAKLKCKPKVNAVAINSITITTYHINSNIDYYC